VLNGWEKVWCIEIFKTWMQSVICRLSFFSRCCIPRIVNSYMGGYTSTYRRSTFFSLRRLMCMGGFCIFLHLGVLVVLGVSWVMWCEYVVCGQCMARIRER
jgi:hypothetical protein